MAKRSANRFDEVIGRNIKVARTQKGISQEMLGQALGVSFQQIQKYEKASNRISAGQLVEISRALNVPMSDLLRGVDAGDGEPIAVPPLSSSAMRAAAAIDRIGSQGVRSAVFRVIAELAGTEGIEGDPAH